MAAAPAGVPPLTGEMPLLPSVAQQGSP